MMKAAIARRKPRDLTELRDVLEQEWYALSPQSLSNLVMSMPGRLAKIQANRGGYTGY